MPTYDYQCNACDHTFEHFQSMKDKPLRTCPKCGKKALERLIGTGAALIFKGSGFYQTDYRSDGYKKAKEADGKPSGGESKGAETPAAATKPGESSSKAAAKPDAKEPAKSTATKDGPKAKEKKSKD